MSIISKIKGKKNQINQFWKEDSRFSRKLAKLRKRELLFGAVRLRSLSDYYFEKRKSFILDYLFNLLNETINYYKDYIPREEYVENAPVWVCWWDGYDAAPQLVKQCIKSVVAKAGAHPVRVISKDNYSEYVDIPEYFLLKQQNGQMGLAHFCDYLRVCLIQKYGGLWLDATIFCSDTIPQECFSTPFFTLKSEYKESRYISHYQWSGFCLGGWKNNVFFSFMKKAFEDYWSKEDYAIDYLFFDYIIYIAKEHIPEIKGCLDSVPISNPHRDDLQAAMNAALPAEQFNDVIKDDTVLYKLSWRETYSEITQDGKESVYGFFIHTEGM